MLELRHKTALIFRDRSFAIVIQNLNRTIYKNSRLVTDTWVIQGTHDVGFSSKTDHGLLIFDKHGRPIAIAMYPGHALHYYLNGRWKWADLWKWKNEFADTNESFDSNAPTFLNSLAPGYRIDLKDIELEHDLGEIVDKIPTDDVIKHALKSTNPNILPELFDNLDVKVNRNNGTATINVRKNNAWFDGTAQLRFKESYKCYGIECWENDF